MVVEMVKFLIAQYPCESAVIFSGRRKYIILRRVSLDLGLAAKVVKDGATLVFPRGFWMGFSLYLFAGWWPQ
jgi:hypothetical protein